MTVENIWLIIRNKDEYSDAAAFRKDLMRAARMAFREGDFYNALRAHIALGNKRRANEIGHRCVDEGNIYDAIYAFRFTRNRDGLARLLGNTEFCSEIDGLDNDLLWNYLGDKRRIKFFKLFAEYGKQYGYDDRICFSVSSAITATKNLQQRFDVVVGIPKGGLFSAFVFDLLGWPTYLIEAHNHKNEGIKKWIKKPENPEIEDKRVLICDKDCVSGRTLRLVVDELRGMGATDLGVYFNHDVIKPFTLGIGVVGVNVPSEIKSVYTPAKIGYDELMNAVRALETRL